MKYVGVVLDSARGFSPHLKAICDKAERFLGAVRSLLPNVGEPNDLVRRLYYGVWESVVLYGAPIWASSLGRETNRTIMRRAQRAALIRTSTAYRTVAHGDLCVLTGSMPIYIKAWLRWKQYGVKRRINESSEEMAHAGQEEMKDLETEVEEIWRLESAFHNPYNWTRRSVKDPLIFYKRKRKINYHVRQILTGHGIFNWYRQRIGKESHTSCWDCGAVLDNAEHVLFWCPQMDGGENGVGGRDR